MPLPSSSEFDPGLGSLHRTHNQHRRITAPEDSTRNRFQEQHDRRNQSTQQASTDERYERLMNGYTPISGNLSKPRVIQSNELRKRTLESQSLGQVSPSPNLGAHARLTNAEFNNIHQSPLIGAANARFHGKHVIGDSVSMINKDLNRDLIHDDANEIKVAQVKNMSQSSGAPGGFGVNKA